MIVNNVTVNNQYNQFDKTVLSTGASTNGAENENTHLQEIIDEYKDTVMLGNKETDFEKNYRETLERLQSFAKQFFLDSMAKDRTFTPPQGPKEGEENLWKVLLPGWSPDVHIPRPAELDYPPTGMYDPVAMTEHWNACLKYINDWSIAMDANYAKLGEEFRRQFNEFLETDEAKAGMEEARKRVEFFNSIPMGTAIRIDDMSPEELMSYGFFQPKPDSE